MASTYKRGGKYIASFLGADGLWKGRVAGTDKGEAERLAAFWENEARLRREGLVDGKADALKAAAGRAIAQHVTDYAADLKARGSTEKHYRNTESRVRRMMDLAGVVKLADLSASRINAALERLRDGDEDNRALSKASALHYARAVKMFAKWLVREGKLREDVLASVAVGTVEKSERVHVRRAMTPEEFEALATATETGGELFGMSGKDRVMLYRVAVGTGLRAGELASLKRESFNLGESFVALQAAYSKRRRDDRQPLPSKLVEMLMPWLSGKPKGRVLFTMPPSQYLSAMFRADLRRARARWIRQVTDWAKRRERRKSTVLCPRDESERVLDFHALRHSYISWLVNSGAPVSVCQSLARHSTPTLTLGVYTHVQLSDTSKAVEALPLGAGGPQKASPAIPALKTGTDDAPVRQDAPGRAERALKTDGIFRLSLAQTDAPETPLREASATLDSSNVHVGIVNVHRGGNGDRPEPDSNRRQTDLQSAMPITQGEKVSTLTNSTAASAEPALKMEGKTAPPRPPVNVPADRDFRDLARAWPNLPAAIKAGIVAMVKAAAK